MILNNKITELILSSRTWLLVFLLLFMSFSIISGQKSKEDQLPFGEDTRDQAPPFKERLFFGGNFGLMFGTLTDIQVSPVVGYWVLPRVAIAVGPTYRYLKNEFNRTSIYGGKAYIQLVVIQDLNSFIPLGVHTGVFLHAENELLSLKTSFWKLPPYPTADRFYVNTVLAGGGISQQIGRRSSLNFMILWPLNDSNYDIYSKPEIRISFTF
jgi:hypothetical protein